MLPQTSAVLMSRLDRALQVASTPSELSAGVVGATARLSVRDPSPASRCSSASSSGHSAPGDGPGGGGLGRGAGGCSREPSPGCAWMFRDVRRELAGEAVTPRGARAGDAAGRSPEELLADYGAMVQTGVSPREPAWASPNAAAARAALGR